MSNTACCFCGHMMSEKEIGIVKSRFKRYFKMPKEWSPPEDGNMDGNDWICINLMPKIIKENDIKDENPEEATVCETCMRGLSESFLVKVFNYNSIPDFFYDLMRDDK